MREVSTKGAQTPTNSLPVDPANMEQNIKALLAETCKGVEAEILKVLANSPGA